MFIDTSAFIAIFAGEPEAERLLRAIGLAEQPITSGLVRLETAMVLASQKGLKPTETQGLFQDLLEEGGIEVVAITDAISRISVEACERYGKGRGHPAQLNLADCVSYAVAKAHGRPMLFKGEDFSQTDLEAAPY